MSTNGYKKRYKKGQKLPTTPRLSQLAAQYYETNVQPNYSTVNERVFQWAKNIYDSLVVNQRRKTFIMSKYFQQKVFVDEFWIKMLKRNSSDRRRRLAYFACAIDLIKNTTNQPKITFAKGQKRYEFYGRTKNGEEYVVHLRKNKDGVFLASCYPKQ